MAGRLFELGSIAATWSGLARRRLPIRGVCVSSTISPSAATSSDNTSPPSLSLRATSSPPPPPAASYLPSAGVVCFLRLHTLLERVGCSALIALQRDDSASSIGRLAFHTSSASPDSPQRVPPATDPDRQRLVIALAFFCLHVQLFQQH